MAAVASVAAVVVAAVAAVTAVTDVAPLVVAPVPHAAYIKSFKQPDRIHY